VPCVSSFLVLSPQRWPSGAALPILSSHSAPRCSIFPIGRYLSHSSHPPSLRLFHLTPFCKKLKHTHLYWFSVVCRLDRRSSAHLPCLSWSKYSTHPASKFTKNNQKRLCALCGSVVFSCSVMKFPYSPQNFPLFASHRW